MIRHFFISMYRNILRDKIFTLINLANLTIGFTTFILLGMVVSYEFSYDQHHKNYERIYRVQTKQEDSYPINYCTFSPAAFRYHLMADLPEVEQALLMREVSGGQGSGLFFTLPDGGQLFEKNGYFSENSVFDIFTIHLKEGNAASALVDPNTIVISETLEKKLFPSGQAVGQQIVIGKRYPLVVTAVYADFPFNSNMRPSYLISLSTYETLAARPGYRDDWTYIDNDNYVLLKKGTDPKLVNSKIKDAFKNVKDFEKSSPYLHPLSKHHLSPNSQPDSMIVLSILSLAALLVLILSCVNYVNLSLANSTQRACEIGIKKVVGYPRKAIAAQFLTETVFLTLVAMILGLFAAQLTSPLMSRILQNNVEYRVFENGSLLLIVLLTGLLAGILSGLYPSLVLSSYNPVKVLKGKLFAGSGNSFNLKKVLTATQFSISLFMLIVSFILYNHVNFILKKDLGFDNKNIIFSEIRVQENMDFETIRQKLLRHPEIVDASFSSTIPFQGNIGGFVTWEDAAPDQKEMVSRNYVNYDFIPTYDLKMVAGRNFSKEYPSDNKGCIINETALKVFGWKEPIGKLLYLFGTPYPVIGVVKDFHPFSVHNTIPTYVMFLEPNVLSGTKLLTVRFTPGNEQKARETATRELEAIFPNDPFEFKDFNVLFYLDGAISFWESLKRLFIMFSVVTLVISSCGLFGLILFTTRRRTKEIGIRKVLGSSVGTIYQQLSTEIIGLLGFAAFVGCPAAWYIYKTMPGAYKEPLSIYVFLVAIILVALVAFVTISYHVLKVAMNNPAEALKYE
ncbi:MAG TPA: ABC transporter permease [Prolixibacteraceae bacterium]|nr:ABC transporter permease [Prolixibacteraceae bacterium]